MHRSVSCKYFIKIILSSHAPYLWNGLLFSLSYFFIHVHNGTLRYLLVIQQHLFHLIYPQPFPLDFDWERHLEFQFFRRYYEVHTTLVNCAHFQRLKFCFQGHLLFFWDVRFLLEAFWWLHLSSLIAHCLGHQIWKSSFFPDLWLR